MIKRILLTLSLVLSLPITAPSESVAQTDAEYLSAINFRFSNPGARARGMGGVLVPLAGDDATAAFVNPAGLAFLRGNQLAIEYVSEQDKFPASRVETGLDNGAQARTPRRRQIETESEFASFVSFTFDISSPKWGVSVFYANLLDTDATPAESFIDAAYFPEIDPTVAFLPIQSRVSATNEIYGASLGYRLSPRFAIGASLGVSEFDFRGESRRDFFFEDIYSTQSSSVEDDTDLFLTIGGLWRINESWSLGASWQKESSYEMSNEAILYLGGVPIEPRSFDSEFTIPTRSAMGLVYETARWTLGIEADFIQYSDLLTETETFFGEASQDPSYGYEIDDVIELHLGIERIFTTGREGRTWSLRAGFWQDESHVPYYTGREPLERAWAPRLDEQIEHWTVGFGYESEQYVFGVAADISSDAGNDVLASLIIKFGNG